MRFVATLCSKLPTSAAGQTKYPEDSPEIRIFIEADSWVDARRFAYTRDPQAVTVLATPEDTRATDFELRWVGNDGADGGGPGCKRLQWRETTGPGRALLPGAYKDLA
jgi:hypothetical protein